MLCDLLPEGFDLRQVCLLEVSQVAYLARDGDTPELDVLLFISCLETADQLTVGKQLFVPSEIENTPVSSFFPSAVHPTELTPTKHPGKQATQEPTSTILPTKSATPIAPLPATNTPPPPPTLAPTLAPATAIPLSQPPPTPGPGG